MIDDIKINQTPYLGVSKNLMEYFVVIGYDERMIKECNPILQNQKKMPLTIISNVISDLAYDMFEPSIIIKRVYPDKPLILKTDEPPKHSSVIFSSCFDSLDGKKKIVNSGYALRFYEKYIDINKEVYYVPKAFLIFSQYPYFSTYYQICQKIMNYYTSDSKNKIPIEILIYCFINYIPSPINSSIILNDFQLNITIPKLTGYPYADFNLYKVLNSVSLKDFIKIFLLIYLEIDLLFFSPDIEKLNLFMFMLYLLNYPLTDSNFFWHIEAISENDIKSDYYTAVLTGFKGINTKYRENLDLSRFSSIYFIVDLESDNAIVNIRSNKESKKIVKLLKYIDNILNKKNVNSVFLKNYILTLKQHLLNIENEFPNLKEILSYSFFSMNKEINKINRKIQQIFYDFIIDTLIILSKDLELDQTSKFPVNIKYFKDKNMSSEENIFLEKTRATVKYNTYFDLFIKRFSVNEELSVSLLFIDEFVDLKKNAFQSDKFNLNYFRIIDDLYYSKTNNMKINFTILHEEVIKYFDPGRWFLSRIDRNNSQLFSLNKEIIKVFVFQKKNKDYYYSLKKKEETKPESIFKNSIIIVTQNYFLSNYILTYSFFIRSSIVYIFSITFPIISFSKSPSFLEIVLQGLKKIKYFQRYYIFILLKSISKYYIINKQTGQFPNFTFEKIVTFYKLIQNYLKNNSIIQNEEIFCFYKKLSEENTKYIQEEIQQKIINKDQQDHFVYQHPDKEEYIDIKTNDDMVTEKHSLLIFRRGNEIMGCNKLRLDLLIQQTYSLHDYYFTVQNYNIENLEVDEVINICINLLFELKKTNDKVIKYFLYNLIPLLKRLKNKINIFKHQKKENEKDKINENKKEEKDDKIEENKIIVEPKEENNDKKEENEIIEDKKENKEEKKELNEDDKEQKNEIIKDKKEKEN